MKIVNDFLHTVFVKWTRKFTLDKNTSQLFVDTFKVFVFDCSSDQSLTGAFSSSSCAISLTAVHPDGTRPHCQVPDTPGGTVHTGRSTVAFVARTVGCTGPAACTVVAGTACTAGSRPAAEGRHHHVDHLLLRVDRLDHLHHRRLLLEVRT